MSLKRGFAQDFLQGLAATLPTSMTNMINLQSTLAQREFTQGIQTAQYLTALQGEEATTLKRVSEIAGQRDPLSGSLPASLQSEYDSLQNSVNNIKSQRQVIFNKLLGNQATGAISQPTQETQGHSVKPLPPNTQVQAAPSGNSYPMGSPEDSVFQDYANFYKQQGINLNTVSDMARTNLIRRRPYIESLTSPKIQQLATHLALSAPDDTKFAEAIKDFTPAAADLDPISSIQHTATEVDKALRVLRTNPNILGLGASLGTTARTYLPSGVADYVGDKETQKQGIQFEAILNQLKVSLKEKAKAGAALSPMEARIAFGSLPGLNTNPEIALEKLVALRNGLTGDAKTSLNALVGRRKDPGYFASLDFNKDFAAELTDEELQGKQFSQQAPSPGQQSTTQESFTSNELPEQTTFTTDDEFARARWFGPPTKENVTQAQQTAKREGGVVKLKKDPETGQQSVIIVPDNSTTTQSATSEAFKPITLGNGTVIKTKAQRDKVLLHDLRSAVTRKLLTPEEAKQKATSAGLIFNTRR